MEKHESIDFLIGKLPKDAKISKWRFEAANIVLFTESPSFFLHSGDTIRELAKELKKRIEVRADPALLVPADKAEGLLSKIIPKTAGVTSVDFDEEGSKVLIEAEKPGMVIGKNGETLHSIKKDTRWTPDIFRTPPMKSDIITTIRNTLIENSKKRADFLHKVGERIYMEGKDPEWVRVSFLGGAREVGRSCMLLQTPESNVMLDCGVNVANDANAYPYVTAPEFNIQKLDAVVITHAHLDHSGFIPYLYKYGYKGPVYTTAPTRALMALLQLDYIDVVFKEGKSALYSSKDIRDEILHTILLEDNVVTDITPDIRLTLYNAGHIIGSSMAHLHIGDGLHNLVYTGDLKYDRTMTLEPSSNKFPRVETVILESTYGASGDIQRKREEADDEMISVIQDTIARGGKVLIPVLGVGRSQELMLLIEERFRKGELKDIPVYLDGMMWDATAIHTTYPEFLSRNVRKQVFRRDKNPLMSECFKRVGSQKERDEVVGGGPCVIMATSGMLTGGSSVQYLQRLGDEHKNSLVFINYQGEGSLGKRIQKGWREIPIVDKTGHRHVTKINLDVHTISGFSAHASRTELMKFVSQMQPRPRKIILNHGESSKCVDLTKSLHRALRIETVAPKNLEVVRLR